MRGQSPTFGEFIIELLLVATSLSWKINSQPVIVCSCLLNTYVYIYIYCHLKIGQNIFPSLHQIKVVYLINTYEIPMLTVQDNPQQKANPNSLILLVVVVVARVPLGSGVYWDKETIFFVASLIKHNFPLLCSASFDDNLFSSSTCPISKDRIRYD